MSARTKNKAARSRRETLIVGVDTGGTFTDIVWQRGGRRGTLKVLSTPKDPAVAVLDGLRRLFAGETPNSLSYGTTVATNAMLERKGARTVLLTTAGFEDLLEIGRQDRPQLYDLEPQRVQPLVPSQRRLGVDERTHFDGCVAIRVSPAEIERLIERIERSSAESIAVCFLHAHRNGENERRVARALGRRGWSVSASHELCPQSGEYERATTTTANAIVRPIVERHLRRLACETRVPVLRVMQSNGGTIGAETAAREPIRTMLSGPAGGVVEAASRARRAGFERVVTFDMGGTSTDVCFVGGALPLRPITTIGGLPIRSPSIAIHTVGAGGGSVAWLDDGGALRVGPESAGADPGPACYGSGRLPTVTDANCVLGRLRPETFLGGGMRLDGKRARRALAKLARRMKSATVEQAAEGVVRVVEGTMQRALRVITVERGEDPRGSVLVAFGGAAALHACGLAEALGIRAVLLPHDAGLVSAWGVLAGPVTRDRMRAYRALDPSYRELCRTAGPLRETARREVAAEGFPASRIRARCFLQARYAGQSAEIEVPLARDYRRRFHREHLRLLHSCDEDRQIEVIGLRASAVGLVRTQAIKPGTRPREQAIEARSRAPVYLDGRWRRMPILDRSSLAARERLRGPAILTEYSSTILVRSKWSVRRLDEDNLLMERSDGGPK